MFRKHNTFTNKSTSSNHVYISLMTVEADDCIGHWIWECAVLLPYIIELKEKMKLRNKKIKILIGKEKQFKTIFLRDFPFEKDELVLSDKFIKYGRERHEQYAVSKRK